MNYGEYNIYITMNLWYHFEQTIKKSVGIFNQKSCSLLHILIIF